MVLKAEQAQASGKRARTREQILDAAVACFAEDGIRQSNMVDIAERAGVGRSTLYRHFPKLEDIVVQVLIRDLEELVIRTADLSASCNDIEDVVVESYVFILRELPQRPVLNLLFRQDAELIHHLSLEAEAFNELGARFSAPTYEMAKKANRLREGVTLEEFVEWATRMLISLASMPYAHQKDGIRTRQYLRRFLLPSLLTGL